MSKIRDDELSETKYVSEGDEFGQGDIVYLATRSNPPFYGVIINADCDLAHRKTDGVISFLPIYRFEEYFFQFQIFKLVEEEKNNLVRSLLSIVECELSERNSLIGWLHDSESDVVCDKLIRYFSVSQKKKVKLEKMVHRYVSIFVDNVSAKDQFFKICSLENDAFKFLVRKMQSAYQDLGEGHLFINEIFDQDGIGFVIRMRRIYSIDEVCCYKSDKSRVLSKDRSGDYAVRVCKLDSIFQFKLAQLFAYQFSRVGLPDQVRDMHPLVIEGVAEDVLGQIS